MVNRMKDDAKWLLDASDNDADAYFERERDERFLDFAAMVQIGAEAIREKRRLQAELEKMTADRNKWRKLCEEGDAARGHILGDLMTGLTTGVLKIDRDVPLPDRFKEKTT